MIFASFVYNRGVCAVACKTALLQPLWLVAASCRLTTRGRVAQASAAGVRLVDWSDGIDDKSVLNNLSKENTRVVISVSFISWLEGSLWPQYLASVGEGLWVWVGGFSWVKPWSPSCHIATSLQGVEVCFTSNHHSWHASCISKLNNPQRAKHSFPCAGVGALLAHTRLPFIKPRVMPRQTPDWTEQPVSFGREKCTPNVTPTSFSPNTLVIATNKRFQIRAGEILFMTLVFVSLRALPGEAA